MTKISTVEGVVDIAGDMSPDGERPWVEIEVGPDHQVWVSVDGVLRLRAQRPSAVVVRAPDGERWMWARPRLVTPIEPLDIPVPSHTSLTIEEYEASVLASLGDGASPLDDDERRGVLVCHSSGVAPARCALMLRGMREQLSQPHHQIEVASRDES